MPTHTVKPGECVASLAAKCGSTVDAIWNDPANAALKRQRPSPFMLAPGDQIELPEPRDEAHGQVEQAGHHRLRARVDTVRLRLALVEERWGDDVVRGTLERTENGYRSSDCGPVDVADAAPLANVAFRLEVGGRTVEGTTDGEGVIDEAIDARATIAHVVLEPGTTQERTMEIHIGYLDPIEEASGVVQRLRNLGFGGADGGVELENAVAAFQKKHGLEVSGELDDATRDKLADVSGG